MSELPAARSGQPARREALLDAAFEALVQDGPHFRVERVAARADASKALVYHHFGSREGLLDAMAGRVLAQTQDGLERLVMDYPNPRERLDALARTLLEEPRDSSPTEARRVHLFWMQDDAAGTCRGALRDSLIADFVSQTIHEGVALGVMRAPAAGADTIAVLLLGRWHGATVQYAEARVVDFEREQERLVTDIGRAL
ncbi:MAG: helix-turn-helix domain-containing protein [Candidatus Thermoplasmatota archaeon]